MYTNFVKIPKGELEVVNRRIANIMTKRKRTNNDLRNITLIATDKIIYQYSIRSSL
jgi:hypothetical protein